MTWVVKDRARTPISGGFVTFTANPSLPATTAEFDFSTACRTHHYGYDLIRYDQLTRMIGFAMGTAACWFALDNRTIPDAPGRH